MWHSPAVHFLLIGGLIFGGVNLLRGQVPFGSSTRPPIAISKSDLQLAYQAFYRANGQPPTPEDRARILDTLVDQAVLYQYALELGMAQLPAVERRLAQIATFVAANPHEPAAPDERAREALDLGLHHGDLVVRRMLIDSARRLIRAVVLVRQPSDDALEAYFRDHQELFRLPAETRLTHVMVNRLKHGTQTEARATALLQRLQQGPYTPEAAVQLGDRAFVPSTLPSLPDRELARRLGHRFTRALKHVPETTWSGPIPSRYGLHMVYVHARTAPRLPPLSQVRHHVQRHLLNKRADEWLALRLQQLRQTFEIIVPEAKG
jgi:hypothetical protein